jgi:flagellar basal-body rod protein FlgB
VKLTGFNRLARILLTCFVRQSLYINNRKLQMSETDRIIDLIQAGIKAEGLRQKAIANNVANLETPGYRRIDVKFEEILAKSLDSSEPVDLNELVLQICQPKKTPVKSNGNDVSLENEVGAMIKNSLRHQTYIRLLSKRYKQIELAINVGAR